MAMAEHVEALNALRAEASLAALEVDATERKSELQRVEQKIAELRERYSLLQAEVKKADAVTKAHAPE
jgi:t-SNARE complex subunit (syntaxin)